MKNSHVFVTPVKKSLEFASICHTCEEFVRFFHICDKYVRILHTSERFVRKFVDRPEFGLVLAQLDIEALTGKFHSNPRSSF